MPLLAVAEGRGSRNPRHEHVELRHDKAERDNGDAGAHDERPLIGGVVALPRIMLVPSDKPGSVLLARMAIGPRATRWSRHDNLLTWRRWVWASHTE
jgi:hypothetical protein